MPASATEMTTIPGRCAPVLHRPVLDRDREIAALRHRVAGVHRQIQERCLELRPVDADRPDVLLGLERHPDALPERPLHQLQEPGHQLHDIDRRREQGLASGESKQAMREVGAALRALHRHAGPPLRFLVLGDRPLQELEIADHHAEHVVEVVRNAARQTAYGLELARVEQILLELLAFGDIEPKAEELARLPVVFPDENRLVEKMVFRLVCAPPAILQGGGPLFRDGRKPTEDAFPVVRVNPGRPEIRPVQKCLRRKAGDPLHAFIREVESPMVLVETAV